MIRVAMRNNLSAQLVALSLLTLPCRAQPTVSTPDPLILVTSTGTWDFAGGAAMEVTSNLIHGADMITCATIYWPQTTKRKACHFLVIVACDAFGKRDPWALVFSPSHPVLWVFHGEDGQRGFDKPTVGSVDRIDLGTPTAIVEHSVVGSGPARFLPEDVAKTIRKRMVLPAADDRAPTLRTLNATADRTLEVLCRVRVVAKDGTPVAGIPVRFPVLRKRKPHRQTSQSPPPHALHEPSNSGLDVVQAITDAAGYATGLVPVSSRARGNGATVRPAVTNLPGAGAPAIALTKIRRLAPLELSKEAIEARFRELAQPEDGGVLRGRLVSSTGQPRANCTLAVMRCGSSASAIQPCTTCTDADGRFVLRGVPELAQWITVRSGKQCATLPARIEPAASDEDAESVELELELDQEPERKTWFVKKRTR